ncbi:MAG: ammonium transporter [Alphaproteobacteria bacterium]|nr:ammonium transporter [Alphaproteobacteria bacterium]
MTKAKRAGVAGLGAGLLLLASGALAPAMAQAAPPALAVNKADDVWMMVSTVLVLLMTVPGLALFYGGMVRTKNMASVLIQIFMIECLVCVLWFLYGYSLAFTGSEGVLQPFIGGLGKAFLKGVPITAVAETFTIGVGIHEIIFVCFQMTFAAITTALAIGAFVERVKFVSLVFFAGLWMTFVYCPIAHMVWFWPGPSGVAADPASADTAGFLWQLGAIDFAGGSVVHINAGVAGLVGAIIAGHRRGYEKEAMPPHSVTLAMVGAALLWVGWFGFNAGSNLEANEYAALALANTFIATAMAGFTWTVLEWIVKGKPSLLGLITGVVAGLVAVTPASGFAGPMGALVLGLVVSPVCFFFCTAAKKMFGYDDSLDAFGVHGVGGMVGAILTGILVNPALGGTGIVDYATCAAHGFESCDNAPYSLGGQLLSQIWDVGTVVLWSVVGSTAIFFILKAIFGLRVGEDQELEGLDISEHGERAYNH